MCSPYFPVISPYVPSWFPHSPYFPMISLCFPYIFLWLLLIFAWNLHFLHGWSSPHLPTSQRPRQGGTKCRCCWRSPGCRSTRHDIFFQSWWWLKYIEDRIVYNSMQNQQRPTEHCSGCCLTLLSIFIDHYYVLPLNYIILLSTVLSWKIPPCLVLADDGQKVIFQAEVTGQRVLDVHLGFRWLWLIPRWHGHVSVAWAPRFCMLSHSIWSPRSQDQLLLVGATLQALRVQGNALVGRGIMWATWILNKIWNVWILPDQ